jgi:hypothetical protein
MQNGIYPERTGRGTPPEWGGRTWSRKGKGRCHRDLSAKPFLEIECRPLARPTVNIKDAGHLFRLAAVFVVGFIVFLVVRNMLVPRSFGKYGHFRADAIPEIQAQPIFFAGHQVCEDCHSEVLDVKKKGRHARVNCEACHGPLAEHTEDPGPVKPVKLDAAVLCVRCHEANIAKPAKFPQVVSSDHSSGLACDTCHQPHSPAIDAGGKK